MGLLQTLIRIVNVKKQHTVSMPDRLEFAKAINDNIDETGIKTKVYQELRFLCQNQSFEKLHNTNLAYRQFTEFFEKLISRYIDVLYLEKELVLHDDLNKRNLSEIQMDFVDKTEIFHQGLYAMISSFIKLLSHLEKQNSFLLNMPSKSVSSFLNYSKNQIPSLLNQIQIIEKSTSEYRVKYVDHTNQHPVYDWWTFSFQKSYVIYLHGVGTGEVRLIKEISFGEIQIFTPMIVQSYFIPPHHSELMTSTFDLFNKCLVVARGSPSG